MTSADASFFGELFPAAEVETLRLVPEISMQEAVGSVAAGTPFLIRQDRLVAAACDCCTVDQLAAAFGDVEIVVEHKHRWQATTERTTARTYLASLADTDYYWRQIGLWNAGLRLPALPRLHARTDTTTIDYLWVGPRATVQTFHQDNHDEVIVNSNAFMQMAGIKYAAIALPTDSSIFEVNPLLQGYKRHSAVSPFDPAVRRACSTLAHAIVRPGDLLYIPPRAWHYFQSLSPSVSISRWWFESRIAETLFLAAMSIPRDAAGPPLGQGAWALDVTRLGGRQALAEFFSRLNGGQQYRAALALVRRYGPLPETPWLPAEPPNALPDPRAAAARIATP